MPPRKNQPSGPTPVEAFKHEDKRVNIPTADSSELVSPDVAQPNQLRYKRNPDLDPQLVWTGKDEQDGEDLVVDAPPIYIQEKIVPQVIIENLRKVVDNPQLTLFADFDGLGGYEAVDYYKHPANWSNRMILGDSLQVMASLAEKENLRGKVQMVYIDPPYGIKFGSNWQARTDKRDVRDGKVEDITREVEVIKAFRDTWELGIHSYLAYLRDRLSAAYDLLTDSGSVFVQIGDDNVHLVRSLLDEVFGAENFVSQITFKKTTGAGSPSGGTVVLASVNDFILWYSRDAASVKYRQLYRPKELGGAGAGQYTWVEESSGVRRRLSSREVPPEDSRIFRTDQLTSQSAASTTRYPVELGGKTYMPGNGYWKTPVQGMERLAAAERLLPVGNTLTYVRYLDDFPAFPFNNLWDDTVTSGFADSKIYVVQTNPKVIERCMLMTTDPTALKYSERCPILGDSTFRW